MRKFIPKIGIIAGAGVAAGVEILSRFEKFVTEAGARQNQEHPEIVLYQATQAPSRSLFLEKKGESFIPYYIEAAKKLKEFGCNFICMSCNTAHYAVKDISEQAGIEIIDMIEETFKFIKANFNFRKIGVICSDGSKNQDLFNIYARKILDYDYEIIYPNEIMQKLSTEIINGIKLGKHRDLELDNSDHPSYILSKIISNLESDSCDIIILGCTEISLAYNYLSKSTNIIDSMDILVEKSLEKHKLLLGELNV